MASRPVRDGAERDDEVALRGLAQGEGAQAEHRPLGEDAAALEHAHPGREHVAGRLEPDRPRVVEGPGPGGVAPEVAQGGGVDEVQDVGHRPDHRNVTASPLCAASWPRASADRRRGLDVAKS